VNNYNRCDCFLKGKENTTTDLSTNRCTVIQAYFCCNIHNNCTVGPIQKCRIRHDRILSIRRISDFRKVSDSVGFGFGIRHIPRVQQCDQPLLADCQEEHQGRWQEFKTKLWCSAISAFAPWPSQVADWYPARWWVGGRHPF